MRSYAKLNFNSFIKLVIKIFQICKVSSNFLDNFGWFLACMTEFVWYWEK